MLLKMRPSSLAALALLLMTGKAMADGFIIVKRDVGSVEAKPSSDAQRALLIWRDGKETLHLLSTYRGPAADFAWVIPVPTRPTVQRSSWQLFDAAEKWTRPSVRLVRYEMRRKFCGCAGPSAEPTEAGRAESKIVALESWIIGEFHVDILAAQGGGGLGAWLRENGYAIPGEAEPVLEQYVKKAFYFVAAKIRKDALGGRATVTSALTPLAITFATEKPFYPLAISAISSAPENELLLVTVTPWWFEPENLPCTWLGHGDVWRGLRSQLAKQSYWARFARREVDFAPAIRAAQDRMAEQGVVLEACNKHPLFLADDHDLTSWQEPGSHGVKLMRFHAFLKPQAMRDITFRRLWPDGSADDEAWKYKVLPGVFEVYLDNPDGKPWFYGGLSMSGVGLALALATVAMRQRRRRVRPLAVFCLLASGIIAL
ncbi:MAG: DUF2330 domain-containing protein [Planctomycetes bacterium]|nr:DUF2330 domain-containing protein [Planctomycetota bacterium]